MLQHDNLNIHPASATSVSTGLTMELSELLARVAAAEDGPHSEHQPSPSRQLQLTSTPVHRIDICHRLGNTAVGSGSPSPLGLGGSTDVTKPFCALSSWVDRQVTPSRPTQGRSAHQLSSTPPPPLMALGGMNGPTTVGCESTSVTPTFMVPSAIDVDDELDVHGHGFPQSGQHQGVHNVLPPSMSTGFSVTGGTSPPPSMPLLYTPPRPSAFSSGAQPSTLHHPTGHPMHSGTSAAAVDRAFTSMLIDPVNANHAGSPSAIPRFTSIASDLFTTSSPQNPRTVQRRGLAIPPTARSGSPATAEQQLNMSTHGSQLHATSLTPPPPLQNPTSRPLPQQLRFSGLSPSATPFVMPSAASSGGNTPNPNTGGLMFHAATPPAASSGNRKPVTPFQPFHHHVVVGNVTPVAGNPSSLQGATPPPTANCNLTLAECRGRLLEVARDQSGCRFLQRLLETQPFDSADVQEVLHALFPHLPLLMADAYGNFLLQKLLEFAPDETRIRITMSVVPYIAEIAVTQHGTFSVQKLIESVRSPSEAAVIANGVHPDQVPLLINDGNGAHVVSKVLSCLPAEHRDFLYTGIAAHVLETCNHRQGCCAVQRCIEVATVEQFQCVEDAVMRHIIAVLSDPFGNYVVSRLLDRGAVLFAAGQHAVVSNERCAQLQRYADAITGRSPVLSMGGPPPFDACQLLSALCKNKFSSNVVEKLLRYAIGTPALMTLAASMVSTPQRPLEILFDGFGNYVVQGLLHALSTALVVTTQQSPPPASSSLQFQQRCLQLLMQLLDVLLPAMPMVSQQNFGKRVEGSIADAVFVVATLCSSSNRSTSASGSGGEEPSMALPEAWLPLPTVIAALVAQKQCPPAGSPPAAQSHPHSHHHHHTPAYHQQPLTVGRQTSGSPQQQSHLHGASTTAPSQHQQQAPFYQTYHR